MADTQQHSEGQGQPTTLDPLAMIAQAIAQLTAVQQQQLSGMTTVQPTTPKDGKLDVKALPQFYGKVGSDNVDKFVDQMERAFNAFSVHSNERRVYYASNQFCGTASNWWFAKRQTNGSAWEQTLTWEEFKDLLQQQFKPVDFNLLIRDKLENLRQHTSADEYTNKFMDLVSQLPDMSEDDRIHRYLRGLKNKTAAHVRATQPQRLQDAIDSATTFDHSYFGRHGHATGNEHRERPTRQQPDNMEVDTTQFRQAATGQQQRAETRECYNCGKKGHLKATCWKRKQNQPTQQQGRRPGDNNHRGNDRRQ